MFWFYVIVFGFWSIVHTNPIPDDSNHLNVDSDTSLEVQSNPILNGVNSLDNEKGSSLEFHLNPDIANGDLISSNSDDLLYSDCSSKTSNDNLAENDLLSADNPNLWRRGPSYCKPRMTDPSPGSDKPNNVDRDRVESESEQRNLLKLPNDRRYQLEEPSDELCPDEMNTGKKTPATCAGPEFWAGEGARRSLILVGFCEIGKFNFLATIFNQNHNLLYLIRSQIGIIKRLQRWYKSNRSLLLLFYC